MDQPQTLSRESTRTILDVYSRWTDDASRREFGDQLRYRLYGEEMSTPHRPPAEAYFPEFIPLRADEHFVDCGAYTGDTLAAFVGLTGGTFGRYYAIEPDPQNYRTLSHFVATLPADIAARVHPLPVAVSDVDGGVPFLATGTEMSMICEPDRPAAATCDRVDSFTLDALLRGEPPPTFIKMDIEGAEPAALVGASVTLRLTMPTLAVCVYHRLDHLWTIPDLIYAINPSYRLYLRRYGPDHWETVCYAVEPNRTGG